ncbi:toll-like receptor 4 [Mya arenaria]|uniref:toll-like receptor 4 n=1 Tax=Mya arenaria TaxID=6604 RepID=UPI0022E78EA1|nr:toll-like receptor 4 [Mya arenaria]
MTTGKGYREKAIARLTNLEELWLDSLPNATFGEVFRNLTSLKTHKISGVKVDPTWILNEFCCIDVTCSRFDMRFYIFYVQHIKNDISYGKLALPIYEFYVHKNNSLKTVRAAGCMLYCWEGPVHGLEIIENIDLSLNYFSVNISEKNQLNTQIEYLEQVCASYTHPIIGLSVVIAIAVNIIVAVIVHRNRWKIRYWFYVSWKKFESRKSDKVFLQDDDILPAQNLCNVIGNALHVSRTLLCIVSRNCCLSTE